MHSAFSFLLLLAAANMPGAPLSDLQVQDLRCEYRINPAGIDAAEPKLSWKLLSTASGAMQKAYQILVASSAEALAQDQADVWDSGRVPSDQSVHVPYSGNLLASRQQCFWKVRVWDGKNQVSAWSEPAHWSMGLLAPGDWSASWIGLDENPGSSEMDAAHWVWYPEGNPASAAPPNAFFPQERGHPRRQGAPWCTAAHGGRQRLHGVREWRASRWGIGLSCGDGDERDRCAARGDQCYRGGRGECRRCRESRRAHWIASPEFHGRHCDGYSHGCQLESAKRGGRGMAGAEFR